MCIVGLQLLLRGASQRGAKRIRVHVLTDGRDVLDGSSVGFNSEMEEYVEIPVIVELPSMFNP